MSLESKLWAELRRDIPPLGGSDINRIVKVVLQLVEEQKTAEQEEVA